MFNKIKIILMESQCGITQLLILCQFENKNRMTLKKFIHNSLK